MTCAKRWIVPCGIALIAAAAAAVAAPDRLGFSRSVTPGLTAHFERLFGQRARARLLGWRDFAVDTAGGPEPGRISSGEREFLGPVNGFFNRVPYVTDEVHWRAVDYWATPAEFVASNGGDCEDFAIAKYFMLKELGVPVSRLRMVYARTWKSNLAHMVLAYYSAPGAEPLILDSLEGGIHAASDRPDLVPVYTFNDDDLVFAQPGLPAIPVSTITFRLWREVLARLERELTY